MKEVNMWEKKNTALAVYFNKIEDIIKYIKENDKIVFSVIDKDGLQDGSITTYFIDKVKETAKEQNVKITFVDDEHPFFYDSLDNIYFSKEFFNKNKDIILSTIEDIMFKKESVFISKYAYSDELVKNLCLTATTISFDEEIEVPEDVIKVLKYNRINTYQYKKGEKLSISTDQILGQNYSDVTSSSSDIYLKNNITDLENLKVIPEYKTIHIKQVNEFEEDAVLTEDYDSLYNIISTLRKNNQNNKVIVYIKNRNAFSKSKLYNSDFDIVIDGIDIEPYKLQELKEEDKLLDLMIKDIKNSNYSMFEKYIAAYNIVKKFKKYLESSNDKDESRYVKKLLNNDYMVCVGYAKLLEELLERLDIKTYHYNVSTDISYDEGFTLEEKEIELAGHARVIVKIDDPKYDINGVYVADPTWDNDLKDDYYNHALMSFDKTGMEKRMFRLSSEDLIMNVKNMEEFSYKVNFLIEHEKSSVFNKNLDEKSKETNAIRSLVNTINSILISLFPEKYKELKKRYPNILIDITDIKEINEFITNAGEIFISNLGKDVLVNKIIEAAGVVNKDVFGFSLEQAKIYNEHVLQMNIESDKLQFPYYYDNTKIK